MPPCSSAAAPTSCAASTCCAGLRRASRRGCLVILGASGAGKSSFLRAGLWPRLFRDDSQWLPLRAIRAGRGGAIEGSEGLLAALEDVHRRFALRASRADLRDRLATPDSFVALLRELRQAAAQARADFRAALSASGPLLGSGRGGVRGQCGTGKRKTPCNSPVPPSTLMQRSFSSASALTSYGAMQGAKALAGIDQVPLSLGPVPHGEIARVIREPAEILRRKAGPVAPVFDAAVIERLQQEIEGEEDALPLLAFVLQRLMREHQGHPARSALPN